MDSTMVSLTEASPGTRSTKSAPMVSVGLGHCIYSDTHIPSCRHFTVIHTQTSRLVDAAVNSN